MPRPVSWLPRLHTIRKTVANSVRSHYGRRDLERLFELQPRAAQKLLELLPSTQVGTSRLVEREALAAFLEQVNGAEDVSAALDALRQTKAPVSRRSLRTLVQAEKEPVSLASLPRGLTLHRGRLEVTFATIEELAQAMYFLARVLDADLEEFARLYEPVPEHEAEIADQEGAKILVELKRLKSIGVDR